jgi:hypothetical protein
MSAINKRSWQYRYGQYRKRLWFGWAEVTSVSKVKEPKPRSPELRAACSALYGIDI